MPRRRGRAEGFARAWPSERADQGACAAAIRPAGNGVRGRGTSRQTSQERRVRAGSCSPKQLQKVTIKQHTKKTTPFLGSSRTSSSFSRTSVSRTSTSDLPQLNLDFSPTSADPGDWLRGSRHARQRWRASAVVRRRVPTVSPAIVDGQRRSGAAASEVLAETGRRRARPASAQVWPGPPSRSALRVWPCHWCGATAPERRELFPRSARCPMTAAHFRDGIVACPMKIVDLDRNVTVQLTPSLGPDAPAT